MTRDALLFDAIRTPRGKGRKDGALYSVKAVELLAGLLRALPERNRFDTAEVEDVVMGCVTAVGDQGADIAKTATLVAGWSQQVAGVTLNRFCASGLESINLAAAKIRSGWEDLLVAGGVESMSRTPMGSDGGAWALDPATNLATSFIPQGVSADLIATLEGFDRGTVDAYAVCSQQRAAAAIQGGYFQRSLIPVRDQNGLILLGEDELVRPDTSVSSLAGLSPSFAAMGGLGFDSVAISRYPELESIRHVHHPGNSSGIVDGAAAVLIGSAEAGERLGLKPRAKIVAAAVTSTDPTIMLTGPAPAARKALEIAGLRFSDIDLFEVNEAFAAVVLKFMRDTGVDRDRINVNGGAIALGHPLGATGAMILGTLLDELERRELRRGLATLCVGGGMGIATIIDRKI